MPGRLSIRAIYPFIEQLGGPAAFINLNHRRRLAKVVAEAQPVGLTRRQRSSLISEQQWRPIQERSAAREEGARRWMTPLGAAFSARVARQPESDKPATRDWQVSSQQNLSKSSLEPSNVGQASFSTSPTHSGTFLLAPKLPAPFISTSRANVYFGAQKSATAISGVRWRARASASGRPNCQPAGSGNERLRAQLRSISEALLASFHLSPLRWAHY